MSPPMSLHETVQKFDFFAAELTICNLPELKDYLLKAPVFDMSECVRMHLKRRDRENDSDQDLRGWQISPLPAYDVFVQAGELGHFPDFGALICAGRMLNNQPCVRIFPIWRDPFDWTVIHGGDSECRVFHDAKLTVTSQSMVMARETTLHRFAFQEMAYLSFLCMPSFYDVEKKFTA